MANTNELMGIFIDFFVSYYFVLVFSVVLLVYYSFQFCVFRSLYVYVCASLYFKIILVHFACLVFFFFKERERKTAWSWVGREDLGRVRGETVIKI